MYYSDGEHVSRDVSRRTIMQHAARLSIKCVIKFKSVWSAVFTAHLDQYESILLNSQR